MAQRTQPQAGPAVVPAAATARACGDHHQKPGLVPQPQPTYGKALGRTRLAQGCYSLGCFGGQHKLFKYRLHLWGIYKHFIAPLWPWKCMTGTVFLDLCKACGCNQASASALLEA